MHRVAHKRSIPVPRAGPRSPENTAGSPRSSHSRSRSRSRSSSFSLSLSLFLLFLSFLVSPPSSSLSFASLPFNGSHSLRSYILCALPADSRIAILSRKRERERDERRNFDYDRKICRTIDRFRSVSVSSRGGDAFESIRRKVSAK